MDPQLAEIYGTNQAPEDDLEKSAAAELLVKLAEEEGVDLNQFSDEEITGMVNDLYSGDVAEDEGEIKVAQADDGSLVYVNDDMEILGAVEEENLEKAAEALGLELVQPEDDTEAQEKIAEADTLGRVMAHAMVQELNEIEKEAAGKMEAVKSGLQAAGKAVGGAAKKLGKSTKEGITGWEKAGRGGGSVGLSKAERALKLAPAAGLAAAAGGGAYGGHKALKKQGSALEKLAEERAWELAKEAGYVDDEGDLVVPEQEKQASDLDVAVETAALQMLEQAGIPVEWNE